MRRLIQGSTDSQCDTLEEPEDGKRKTAAEGQNLGCTADTDVAVERILMRDR